MPFAPRKLCPALSCQMHISAALTAMPDTYPCGRPYQIRCCSGCSGKKPSFLSLMLPRFIHLSMILVMEAQEAMPNVLVSILDVGLSQEQLRVVR